MRYRTMKASDRSTRHGSKRLAVVVLFVAAALSLVVLVRAARQKTTQAQSTSEIWSSARTSPGEISGSELWADQPTNLEVIHGTDRTAPDSPAEVLVVDATAGSALSGARIWSVRSSERLLSPEPSAAMGQTDDSGRLSLDLVAATRVDVHKAGFAPRRVELQPKGVTVVAMSRGGSVRVSCSHGGQPLADALVAMSQTELPPIDWENAHALRSGLASGSRGAIHGAVSNADGVAEIIGLPPGVYRLDAYLEGYVPVERQPSGPVAVPGTASVTVRFEGTLAALPALTGDEVLASSLVTRGGTTSSTATMRYLQAERKRLLSAFPTAMDCIVVLESKLNEPWFTSSGEVSANPTATLTVWSELAGQHEHELELLPVHEILGVQELEIKPTIGARPASGHLRLEVLDVDGHDVSHVFDRRVVLMLGEDMRVRLRSGDNQVPTGHFRLEMLDRRWQDAASGVTVSVPGTATIKLPSKARLVRLEVLDADGVAYHRYRIGVSSGGQSTLHHALDASQFQFLLPIGDATFDLHVRGFAPLTAQAHIEPGMEAQVVTLRLMDG
jgi:hypothetical protein